MARHLVTPEVFLDTVFVVALAISTDQYHLGPSASLSSYDKRAAEW